MVNDPLRELARKNGRFTIGAFAFVFESLDAAVEEAGRAASKGSDRHVSGQELLAGMRVQAGRMFGPLAAHVWRSWGVHCTQDWGRVVFFLVEAGMLNSRETDSLDDFVEGFDFDEAFEHEYRIELPEEIGGPTKGS